MAKISLDSIVSGFKSVSKLIANFDKIEDDLNDKVLYRDNPTGEPNQMENNLDMNSQRIVNLVSPVNDSEPARWADVKNGVTGIDEPVPSQTGNAKTPLTTNGTGLVFGQIEADHIDFTNSGTGGAERTLQNKLEDVVNVKDFGAVGDGATDDTAAIQAAVAIGGRVFVPEGVYRHSNLNITKDTILYGEGSGSVLKKLDATSGNMLTCVVASVNLAVRDLTFDGNQAAQTAEQYAYIIRYDAASSALEPNTLEASRCVFKNQEYCSIRMTGSSQLTADTNFVDVTHCQFLGGQDGSTGYDPRYVSITDAGNAIITNNLANFGAKPAGTGVPFCLLGSSSLEVDNQGTLIVSNNTLHFCGREASNSLGAIESYSSSRQFTVSGNTLYDSQGRAIALKADTAYSVVSNNSIYKITGSGAAITMFRSVQASAKDGLIITGNILDLAGSTACRGIIVNGNNVSLVPNVGDEHKYVSVTNNVIANSTSNAIDITNCNSFICSGNSITDGTVDSGIIVANCIGDCLISSNIVSTVALLGIWVQSSNPTLSGSVVGNVVNDVGNRGIEVDSGVDWKISGNKVDQCVSNCLRVQSTTGNVVVSDNFLTNSSAAFYEITNTNILYFGNYDDKTSLTLATISSGSIQARDTAMRVATEASASSDILDTISGGYVGMTVTLTPSDNADTVQVRETGNIALASDFDLTHSYDTITLLWNGSKWVEVSRSDNET